MLDSFREKPRLGVKRQACFPLHAPLRPFTINYSHHFASHPEDTGGLLHACVMPQLRSHAPDRGRIGRGLVALPEMPHAIRSSRRGRRSRQFPVLEAKAQEEKKPFPIIQTVAVVSVLAIGGLIVFFTMGGLKDKKADTPTPSDTASNESNGPGPGSWPPPEAPQEVTALFQNLENDAEVQPAMQSVPLLEIAKGTSKGLSIAAPGVKKVPTKADDAKLDIEGIKKSCAYIKVIRGVEVGHRFRLPGARRQGRGSGRHQLPRDRGSHQIRFGGKTWDHRRLR